jgi:hypothetical protein
MQEIKTPESKGRTKAHPLSFWEEAVREYESAALSVRDFCERKGVGPSTFMKWKSVVDHNRGRSPHFIPVQLKEGSSLDGSNQNSAPLSEITHNKTLLNDRANNRANAATNDFTNATTNDWVLRFGEKLSLKIPQNFDENVLKRLVSALIPCS